MVWQDNRTTTYDIYAARVGNDGVLIDTTGINCSDFRYYQTRPCIAHGDSMYLVAWQDHRSGYGDDIYGTALTPSGVVTDTTGVLFSHYCNAQQYSAGIFDGTKYVVVWQDNRDSVFYDIYSTRIDCMGIMIDPVSTPVCTDRFHQLNPAIAYNGNNCLIVWEDTRNVVNLFDIYGARFDTSGTILDTTNIPVITGYNDQHEPAVTCGTDRYLVVWQDARTGNQGIYGTRITFDGAVVDTSGMIVSDHAWNETDPDITFDGNQYFVVWEDHRDQIHIYGARVDQDGTVLDSNGIPIAVEDYSRAPRVCYGEGMYFTVWCDARPTAGILGARIDTNGILIDTTAIIIDHAGYMFGGPHVVFNGTDYIAAWFSRNQYNGTTDIYGKIISTNGAIIDSFAVFDDHIQQTAPCLVHGAADQVLLTYTGWVDMTWDNHLVQADRIWSIVYPFVGVEENGQQESINPRIIAYPNPFLTQLNIKLQISKSKLNDNGIFMGIYDITGRCVYSFSLPTAYCIVPTVCWDGTDQHGRPCPAGVYFICAEQHNSVEVQKAIKIK